MLAPGGMGAAPAQDAPVQAGLTAERDFDIPAQPLSAAIVAFSRVSGVQVLFHSKTADRFRSRAIRGRMTGGEALRAMLRETGYTIRYVSSSSVTLVIAADAIDPTVLQLNPLVVKADPIRVGGSSPYAAYADDVLTTLRRALQSEAFTSRARFSVSVKVWLGADGRIRRAEIQKSTGDAALDALVLQHFADLPVSAPPPADLPQPLRFKLWS